MTSHVDSNNEIDLSEILSVVWHRKYIVAGFTFIVCIIAAIILFNMDNIYQSKAILKPSVNSGNKDISSNVSSLASLAGIDLNASSDVTPFNTMNAIISDPHFMSSFVLKNHFEKSIFNKDLKVMKDKDYANNKSFFINGEIEKNFHFALDEKTGLILISMQNKDPYFAKQFVDALMPELSVRYRKFELINLQQQIDNYKQEIDKTSDITLKNKLAEVVSGLIQKKIVAQAQKYYGFEVISYPSVADKFDKVGPRRGIILAIIFVSAFIMSSAGAVIFDMSRKKTI